MKVPIQASDGNGGFPAGVQRHRHLGSIWGRTFLSILLLLPSAHGAGGFNIFSVTFNYQIIFSGSCWDRGPTSDFCEEHSLADFREYFLLDEKRVLYKLYDLSHYDVCSSPSLSQHAFNLWSGKTREPEMVTVEEYMKRLLKKIENRYFAEIWSWWKESPGAWQRDVAERELRDQEFYDNIFEQVKAFLGRDLAKMLGDHTAHMSASSIRDFVMARLLPLGSSVWTERFRTVEGNTIVKFLKFIRCSWDCMRSPGFDHLGDRILHHTTKTANGFDGLDIGNDADTVKNNLQKLVMTIFAYI